MKKMRYEIDPHNRLTAQGPYKFRHVFDGEFKISDSNNLTYHIKKSDNQDIPQQIKFSGQWALNEDHNLVLTLDKWNNQVEGNKLILQTDIMDASSNELVFTVGSRDGDGTEHISMLKLSGSWQADAHNRLTFCVEKEAGAKDDLILRGIWRVNKRHEIEYFYKKGPRTGTSGIKFSGHWDIAGNNRLSYILSEDSKSRFDFEVTLERVMRNSIECTVGIGVSPIKKKIVLSGQWHMGEGTDISFEINYGNGKIYPIAVKLTKMLASGEAYVRFIHTGHEFEILGGLGMAW
jgi:hypothetical protein